MSQNRWVWTLATFLAVPVVLLALLLMAMGSYRHWAATHPEQLVGPRPEGLLIANQGSIRISRIRVTYPGGTYTIKDLAPKGGVDENLEAVIRRRGTLVLDIEYADGRRFRPARSVEPPKHRCVLSINIQDDAEVWWP